MIINEKIKCKYTLNLNTIPVLALPVPHVARELAPFRSKWTEPIPTQSTVIYGSRWHCLRLQSACARTHLPFHFISPWCHFIPSMLALLPPQGIPHYNILSGSKHTSLSLFLLLRVLKSGSKFLSIIINKANFTRFIYLAFNTANGSNFYLGLYYILILICARLKLIVYSLQCHFALI